MSGPHVAVIGGGYSGSLQTIHLLKHGATVTLIERSARLARGVAYSTPHPEHLLNVRAAGMSAYPNEPDHFARWLERDGSGDEASFAERRTYGRYLEQQLDAARADAGERLTIVRAEAIGLEKNGAGETVRLSNGACIRAEAVVLAPGNLPPGVPRSIASAGLAENVYRSDPWTGDIAAGLDADDRVLLIGTGLTAVDAALVLDAAGFAGCILALSRRGLLPRAHAPTPRAADERAACPEPRCTDLLRQVRADADRSDWRCAVDSLRPITQQLWASADVDERQRFLRHLRPWWDVHRHRIAPTVADRLERMIEAGRLEIAAGRIASIRAENGGARLGWRPRGGAGERGLVVRRIVDCTGPVADISRVGDPLLNALLAAGRIRPDACRIGIDVDKECRTLGANGEADDRLRVVGPLTKGALWEIVAVPDIRNQVRDVAAALTARSGS